MQKEIFEEEIFCRPLDQHFAVFTSEVAESDTSRHQITGSSISGENFWICPIGRTQISTVLIEFSRMNILEGHRSILVVWCLILAILKSTIRHNKNNNYIQINVSI